MLKNNDDLDEKVKILFKDYCSWLESMNLEDNLKNFVNWYCINNLDIYNL